MKMQSDTFDAEIYAVFLKERATQDLKVAEMLVKDQRPGHSLFFAHAALQKMFAALICTETRKAPPWRKDLTKLAKLAKVSLTSEQRKFLKKLNFYHDEGLYLGLEYPEPSKEEARTHLLNAKKMAESLPNPRTE
jgi:HEPN domain-containing protein